MDTDARLQRRIQRYGWDLAADRYEDLWRAALAPVQARMLQAAALAPGQAVLDVACGTGCIGLAAAAAIGPGGSVLGIDLSGRMVEAAQARAARAGPHGAPVPAPLRFARMDAEALELPDAGFDVALCALGLMYMPAPEQALREMRRVLRPGARVAIALWGARARCAWAEVFPIVDAEVASAVCPLFFRLGEGDVLVATLAAAGFTAMQTARLEADWTHADGDEACDAVFVGGPVALAWSRFDAATRERVRRRYLESIAPRRAGAGYRLSAEFMVCTARVPAGA